MKAYQMHAWMVGAAVVLLAGSSASEAGWFRGGGRCYYYPAESTCSVAMSPAPLTGTHADCRANARGTGGPSGPQTGEPAGTNASGAPGGGQPPDDVRTEHDVRRRVERNAAEPLGLRPFSTVSVMVANNRSST